MVRDPRGGHNRKPINEDFFKIWSPNMAYVLGFMFADGALLDTNKSSRTYYIQFTNTDLPLLKNIRAALSSNHKIYIKKSHIMTHKAKKYLAKDCYVYKFGNKLIYQDLIALGMAHRKSNDMHLPDIPRLYFSYFLRGYFDGDGCINLYLPKNRMTPRLRVIFTSGSTPFLSEIAIKLAEILNISPPRFYKSMGAHNLMASDSVAFKLLEYMYIDLDTTPYLVRKYQKFLNYKDNLIGPKVKKTLGVS